MPDYDAIKMAPFAFLDYFAQWGGRAWQKFIEIGVQKYLGEDLSGKHVLEIGAGMGRMSCLFALLGAKVTAIDIKDTEKEIALQNARAFDVESPIEFIYYDGNLNILEGRQFDIIFTKSTLIYPDDLEAYLRDMDKLLRPDGKVVFIENLRGGTIIFLMRLLKRRSLSFFKRTHYFTQKQVELIKSIFKIELVMRSKFPPVILLCGRKKEKAG